MTRYLIAAGLAVLAIAMAFRLQARARAWNDELAVAEPPLAREAPRLADPHTPRLAGRVVLVVIDGLGADESHLPFLDELRARGAATTARVPYPTISRPNYVTLVTGVPPRDSGVRANRVRTPVQVDTVMDRAQAAGMRVAAAGDFGVLPSLFQRHTPELVSVDFHDDGTLIALPPPITWPVDDARHAASLAALGPMIAALAHTEAALTVVLVLDVDRAGHASGVGTEYRATAAAVDQMLRVAVAGIDLEHDTLIVTADHGHVAPGGHGGVEEAVSHVPLILVGSGVAVGATARDARLIDVAPTVAALLGVPAPGHAEGHALVELLALAPDAAARRLAADDARAGEVLAVADAAIAGHTSPDALRLGALVAGLGLAGALAYVGHRRRVIAFAPGTAAGALGLLAMLLALVAITRGELSPSFVPSLDRTEKLSAIGVVLSLVLQAGASGWALRRAPDRLAAANGLALVGLTLAAGTVVLVRAWFSPPFLDVPSPFWFVTIPALDLAAATCAAGLVLTLASSALRSWRLRRLGG